MSTHYLHHRITILILLFMVIGLMPTSATAQTTVPTATPSAETPTVEVVEVVDDQANSLPGTAETTTQSERVSPSPTGENNSEQVPGATPTVTVTETPVDPSQEITTTVTPVNRSVDPDTNAAIRGVQGVVKLDVSVSPDKVKAGDSITYNYEFENTGSQTYSNIIIEARWTNFKERGGKWQSCDIDPANCLPFNVQGISAADIELLEECPSFIPNSSSRLCYQVASLAPDQTGQFSVKLVTTKTRYPQTGREPTRPAGSGLLYLDGASIPTSEDTTSTLIVGPVFVLTKEPVDDKDIYPLETSEFIITLGNATGSGDIIEGRIRADAVAATNIVLTDKLPNGTELVSADGNYTLDENTQEIIWNIPGPLNPGQTQEFRVTFKKLDIASDCGKISNRTYKVTSDEMPLKQATSTDHYSISGKGVSIKVITPVVIKSIKSSPSSVIYGEEATLTILVQNYYNQPINGADLLYIVQSNAYYIPQSASPAPNTAPDGNTQGGEIIWDLTMPAGTMTTPAEKTFTLRVRGDYTSKVSSGTGVAIVDLPANIPSACVKSKTGRTSLNPRLYVDKMNAEGEHKDETVQQGQQYDYVIEVENRGPTDANNVSIVDRLPYHSRYTASFRYVSGSATVNGNSVEPVLSEDDGKDYMTWDGLSIPSGSTLRITYSLIINGYEFVSYCNLVQATSGDEKIKYLSSKVCVEINPPIQLTKTVNKGVTNIPGDEVAFTLKLQNLSDTTYEIGLYDDMGAFTFESQESGYETPEVLTNGDAQWRMVDVGPSQTLEATIIASVPDVCVSKKYANELKFRFRAVNGEEFLVRQSPAARAYVQLNCGTNKIEYSKSSDRSVISLQDQVTYRLTVKNLNTEDLIRDVTVIDVLPQGFTYVGMDPDSDIQTQPEQEERDDGRMKLTWTIPLLNVKESVSVKFIARSGDTVGEHINYLYASAPDLLEARCGNGCWTEDEGDELITYATRSVRVEPLHTAEPQLTDEENCALSGERRVYRLSLVNTNDHSYQSTGITLTLPLGLKYVRALDGTPPPSVRRLDNGDALVLWRGLEVPAKPKNSSSALVVLEIELEVGQVWHDLPTKVETTSPDGAIPLKDGVLDPIVRLCPEDPSFGKVVSREKVAVDSEVIYMISLANPDDTDMTVTVEDELDPNLTFVEAVEGPAPSVDGNSLTWSGINVPAATEDEDTGEVTPGTTILRFKVRLVSGNTGEEINNSAVVNPAVMKAPDSPASFEIVEIRPIFLPVIAR